MTILMVEVDPPVFMHRRRMFKTFGMIVFGNMGDYFVCCGGVALW